MATADTRRAQTGLSYTILPRLDVMTLTTLMATRNRLPASARCALRVAAFTHDVMTPAGGDTTKLIDYSAFDEDVHYEEVFHRRAAEVEPFLRRYRMSARRLTAIVHNQGVLGKLPDLADKIAYIARNTFHYIHRVHSRYSAIGADIRKIFPHYRS